MRWQPSCHKISSGGKKGHERRHFNEYFNGTDLTVSVKKQQLQTALVFMNYAVWPVQLRMRTATRGEKCIQLSIRMSRTVLHSKGQFLSILGSKRRGQ